MGEPLKNSLGPDVARLIAELITDAYPGFRKDEFLEIGLLGFDELELVDRGRHLCRALRATLPDDPEIAITILIAALGPEDEGQTLRGMEPFRYLPFTLFVSEYGLGSFETSMRALYEMTKRFTSEQAIRAFLIAEQERTLDRLREWTSDPSHHVRRLVSEGTRPRLPWATRLPAFQHDPSPVLELLEVLKDDPSDYVRRSVANNLNDIAKDHPDLAVEVATAWSVDAPAQRKQLIRHAMRSLVKAGHPGALAIHGARHGAEVAVSRGMVSPEAVAIGQSIELAFEVENIGSEPERFVIDFRVHYVKANGTTTAKVFKLANSSIAPGVRAAFRKRLSLEQRTTRRHYPGLHRVDAMVNGSVFPIGEFVLEAE